MTNLLTGFCLCHRLSILPAGAARKRPSISDIRHSGKDYQYLEWERLAVSSRRIKTATQEDRGKQEDPKEAGFERVAHWSRGAACIVGMATEPEGSSELWSPCGR
jgi:hypothetical protein